MADIQTVYGLLATDGLSSAASHPLNYENPQTVECSGADPQIALIQVQNTFPNGTFHVYLSTTDSWNGKGQNDYYYSDEQGRWASGKPTLQDVVPYLSVAAVVNGNGYLSMYWCTKQEHEDHIPNNKMYILHRAPTPLTVSQCKGFWMSYGNTAVPVGVLQVSDTPNPDNNFIGFICLEKENSGSVRISVYNFKIGSTVNQTGYPPLPSNTLVEAQMNPPSIVARVTDLENEMALVKSQIGSIDDRLKKVEATVGDLRAIVASVLAEISTVYVAR